MGAGPAIFVTGEATPITAIDNEDEEVTLFHLNSPAWCPSAYVDQPNAVTNLGYVDAPAVVTLSWTNAEAYDEIQIVRVQETVAGSGVSWTIPGNQTSFADDDPPLGDVEYMVVGVVDGVGDEDSPTVSFTRD